MKTKLLTLLALVIFVAGLTATVQAVETQIVPILEDTQIGGYFNNPPNVIYTMSYIQIGNGTYYAGYGQVYAAVQAMGNTPYKATLNLITYAPFSPEGTYNLYRIKERYDFMKRSKYIVLSGKIAEGKVVNGKYIEFNVTDLVKYWSDNADKNYGFAVKKPNGWFVTVASADYQLGGEYSNPYIKIEANLPPALKAEDIDHDGHVNAWDQLPIFRLLYPDYDLGFVVPPEHNISCDGIYNCDVNNDAVIDYRDLNLVGTACDNADCSP